MTVERSVLYRQCLTQLLEDRVLLDRAIAGMERLVASARVVEPVPQVEAPSRMTVTVEPRAAAVTERVPPQRAPLSEAAAERRGVARVLYEQADPILSLAKVAFEAKVSQQTIRNWAKEEGWKRPAERIRQIGRGPGGSRARQNGAKSEPRREARQVTDEEGLLAVDVPTPVDKLPGMKRRCQECERITMTDPCSHCGAALFMLGRT